MKVIVTGGAGFIGSEVIRQTLKLGWDVVNVDKLTYGGAPDFSDLSQNNANYSFEHINICDEKKLRKIFFHHKPDYIINLAAESHVDRSIDSPSAFIKSNIEGTFHLLETALEYIQTLSGIKKTLFRFLQVSTDEVFGELQPRDEPFTSRSPYAPRSPYSASKAASDHLARAWHYTYNLPVIISHSSNNYGPYQLPEKLIPLMIIKGIQKRKMPIYGSGENIRDWIHVSDHASALIKILTNGRIGESYLVGANDEFSNIKVVEKICSILDKILGEEPHRQYISFVEDRPSHDQRYALDSTKMSDELGWSPKIKFQDGLKNTILWYLDNESWWKPLVSSKRLGDRQGLNRRFKSNKLE